MIGVRNQISAKLGKPKFPLNQHDLDSKLCVGLDLRVTPLTTRWHEVER